MSLTGKQSPLGVNTMSSLLLNQGLSINSVVLDYTGRSKNNNSYTPGELVNETVLKKLTYAINNGYRHSQTGYAADLVNCSITGDRFTVGIMLNGTLQPGQILVDISGPTTIGTLVSQAPIEEGTGTEGTGSVWIISGGIDGTYDNVTATLPITGSSSGYRLSNSTYDRLISIGASRIPALGNSPPPTYIANDPAGNWNGEATTGFPIEGDTGQGQTATWYPWEISNNNSSVTQWGWVRAISLQAWQDFNWGNPIVNHLEPDYRFYTQFYMSSDGFRQQSNDAILAMRNSLKFLEGSFSNMNDLITADITGVSLSTQAFGQDLIALGKTINLDKLDSFGLPSTLLVAIQRAGAASDALGIAMLGAELTTNEIDEIIASETATFEQEQKLFNAFSLVSGSDLVQILEVMRCKTKGLTTLTDLLNVKACFPISYTTLTVPIFNTTDSPANSKIYYLLFVNRLLNPQLLNIPQVPPQVPARPPVIVPAPVEPVQPIEQPIINKPPTAPPTGTVIGDGCPAPWMRILMSDGTYLEAGKLQKGMFIKTKHEHTLEEGDYKVEAAIIDIQPRMEIVFDDLNFVCSKSHRFYYKGAWINAENISVGDELSGRIVKDIYPDLGLGEVVKITVDTARTYIVEGLLSHNIKMLGGGGGCVALESYVPYIESEITHNGRPVTQAWMLEKTMPISLGTESLEIVHGEVKAALNDYQPCVKITTSDGITLVCSTTARIATKENGFTTATELYGKRVAVMRNNRAWYDEVVRLEDVGMKFVRVVDAGNNSFWAGEHPGSYILHHNVPMFDQQMYRYEKN